MSLKDLVNKHKKIMIFLMLVIISFIIYRYFLARKNNNQVFDITRLESISKQDNIGPSAISDNSMSINNCLDLITRTKI